MSKPLENCGVLLVGRSFTETKTNLSAMIRALGGSVSRELNKNVKYVVASSKDDDVNYAIVADMTIYNEDWLVSSHQNNKLSDSTKKYVILKPTKAVKAAAEKALAGPTACLATPVPSPTVVSTSPPATGKRTRSSSPAPVVTPVAASATTPVAASAKKAKTAKDDTTSASTAPDTSSNDAAPALTTIIIKGKAPVDPLAPASLKDYHVYCKGDLVYDAMLNQANIIDNNNKFYLLQVLQHDSNPTQFACWMRWGRVGVYGTAKPVFGTETLCVRTFASKFYDKSGNAFQDFSTQPFIPRTGKYIYIERDYTNDDDTKAKDTKDNVDGEEEKKSDEPPRTFPPSLLPPETQDFVKLICNVENITQQLLEVGFDARKMPLGKLSKANIKRGYTALCTIADVIDEAQKKGVNLSLTSSKEYRAIADATNLFYTYIPHCSGMSKLPIINTPALLKAKLEMLESLGEIEAATKILEDKTDYSVNPIDLQYKGLKCKIDPVALTSEEGEMVRTFVRNSHGATHHFKLTVENVYSLEREGESERFSKAGFDKNHNRQLLWHGSRLTNYMGILSQGLRIAPPEAPVTGYMFGKGVYFADMVSKSAGYCASYSSKNTGVLILCEVALGDCNELKQSNYRADLLPKGKLSTKGLGRTAPDDAQAIMLPGDIKVPLGTPKAMTAEESQGLCLLYNEYIVYDVSQIRMKYLVKLKFD